MLSKPEVERSARVAVAALRARDKSEKLAATATAKTNTMRGQRNKAHADTRAANRVLVRTTKLIGDGNLSKRPTEMFPHEVHALVENAQADAVEAEIRAENAEEV